MEKERSERCRPPCSRAAPWLVFPHGKNGKDQVFYNHFEQQQQQPKPKLKPKPKPKPNNNNKTYYRKSIPEMRRNRYWQSPSHQGWLIILCHDYADDDDDQHYSNSNSSRWKIGDCFLWNPLSFETIQLPNLFDWFDNQSTQYSILDSVLSSPPPRIINNHTDDDDDSMVFFLLKKYESHEYVLVFCRPGVDKQWRNQELKNSGGSSMVCFKGKLHIPCFNNLHLEIEKQPGSESDDEITLSIKSIFDIIDETKSPAAALSSHILKTYVESGDELFKVVRHYYPNAIEKEVIEFQVSRMDFSLMAWEEVKSLGDHVLFLGERTTASCSAAELGLTRGCVYYTKTNDKSLYKFDLEDGSITPYLPCSNLPTPWLSPDWMTIPTTSSVRLADGRRRTKDMLVKDAKEDIIIEVEETKTSENDDENEEGQNNNNNNSGGELEELGTWGTFNEDILEVISSYLHPVDYLHFRAVCKANRMAMPAVNWRTSSIENRHTTSLSPWLIFFRKMGDIYNFVDPMHNNEKYFVNPTEFLLDATIRFSKDGWLLMSKGEKTIFFFNPFTRAMIQLPDLPDDCNYIFSGISFSSLPTSSDCVVFAIAQWCMDRVCISFISRGDDSWSSDIFDNTCSLPSKEKCMEFMPWRNNPVFHDGVFYCLDYKGTIGIFDLEDDFSWKVFDKPQGPCNSIYQCFLVECEGKLLSVFVGHLGKWVRIFRLDFANMVWVKVESLGKHMLFISHTSCLSAIAPDSRMENKIYFPRFHGEGIIFYSLDTGRYHSLGSEHSAQDVYNTKEQLYCSWIEPNWSHTTVQELDWLSV